MVVSVLDKEVSSGEEYENEESADASEAENGEDDGDDDEDEIKPANRRSSAAKRKSIAILAKDETESLGNYRNSIDNGPVPRNYVPVRSDRFGTHSFCLEHALTLNEVAFNVALKLQHRNQDRRLSIEYLDHDNRIEFVRDKKMTDELLLSTHPVRLAQPVRKRVTLSKPHIKFDSRRPANHPAIFHHSNPLYIRRMFSRSMSVWDPFKVSIGSHDQHSTVHDHISI